MHSGFRWLSGHCHQLQPSHIELCHGRCGSSSQKLHWWQSSLALSYVFVYACALAICLDTCAIALCHTRSIEYSRGYGISTTSGLGVGGQGSGFLGLLPGLILSTPEYLHPALAVPYGWFIMADLRLYRPYSQIIGMLCLIDPRGLY